MTQAYRPTLFWGALLLLALAVLALLQSVLLPFIAGFAVAYFLDPVLDWMERKGFSRLGATIVMTAVFVIVVAVTLALILPFLAGELIDLAKALPDLFASAKAKLMELLNDVGQRLGIDLTARLQEAFASSSASSVSTLSGLMNQALQSGLAAANLFGLLLITPFVSFFLMLEWDHICQKVDGWLPRRHLETLRGLFRDIDKALAGFLRGQAMVCTVMAIYYATALSLAGLKFGLLVGLAAGILTFIPFLGALTGLLLTVALTVAQLHGLGEILLPIGLYMLGQIVETNFITPRLVGRRIGMHDVWVIFAVLAGGTVFGLVGALVAVPAAAVLGVIIRFAHQRYLASRYYLGPGGGA